jgi:low affinity Fe/Cu permease
MIERAAAALRHPADRGAGGERGRFDHFAERASFLASSPIFFIACFVVVAAWAVGLVAGASNRFESASAGLMSAVTLILVAVLKNAELRADRAVQRKLDAIAGSLLGDKRGDDGDSEHELESVIGVHEQI